MGQEVDRYHFNSRDFKAFKARLKSETVLLTELVKGNKFENEHPLGGIELELWLINASSQPAPANDSILDEMNDPRIVPELARFNLEINTDAYLLKGDALSQMLSEVEGLYAKACQVARGYDLDILAIGILPTVQEKDLTLGNMSGRSRYRALNEQVLRLRQGRPLPLDINGREQHLRTAHHDVMLESAATSLQIHMQVEYEKTVRLYNAGKIIAAPMTALAANSPYLFGKELWDETRIPLFEQAVAVSAAKPENQRVTFGRGFVKDDLLRPFLDNHKQYQVLLPILFDDPPEELSHLRLHNGTIWRWNRPLVCRGPDQKYKLRLEHRVASAGPTLRDAIANSAFFFGLANHYLVEENFPDHITFAVSRNNFYQAARYGLSASVEWLDGKKIRMDTLLMNELLPAARSGLQKLGIAKADIESFIGLLEKRVRRKRNGALWQKAFVGKYGHDMKALVQAYLEKQNSGEPVGEWSIL